MAKPITIMAITQPVAQPFEAVAARLKGRRKIIRPPAKRRTPMTEERWMLVKFAMLYFVVLGD
jgi:hypothetical protein